MDGADFDVILRPIKVKVPRTQLITTRFPQDPLHAHVSDTTINPLALKTGETEETQYELVISFLKDKFVVPVELAAAGMFEALYVLTAVIYSRMKVILLDEPASNLHPTLQKKVLDLIHNKTIAEYHNQVIMITHSPYLLEAEEGENIWRFSLDSNKGSIALRMVDALAKLQPHAVKQILKNLRNSEIRSILFSRGLVLVEGISDRFVVQAIDRHLSSYGKGADLGNNEWSVLEISGKENLQYFTDMARIFVIPYVAVVDYDALMKINGHIKQNGKTIRTSAVFVGLANTLTKEEISTLKELEVRISSHKNKKGNSEEWYDNDIIETLEEMSSKHGVYALTNDLEGVLQNPATARESKPLKALEWVNRITCEESIPSEFRELNTYLIGRVEASTK